MRVFQLGIVALFAVSCGFGEKEIKENPTNCAVKEVEEGVEFRCVDKNGVETSGTVKHGQNGAKGEQGPAGPKGEGLKPARMVECKGSIEGWLQNSKYEIEFHQSEFETGDTFLSSVTKLYRGSDLLNERWASAFFLSGEKKLHDGLFMMKLIDKGLEVKSEGGVSAVLPCKEA